MARLNIEDSLWTDNRFLSLCMKLASIDAALGALIRSWVLAQKWYLRSPNRRVPLSEWQKQNLPKELFDCGLATIQDSKWVHVAGSDDQFGWLVKSVIAGKKGGEAKARNALERAKKQVTEIIDKTSQGTLQDPKGNLPSSSSSSSSSNSFSDSKKTNVGIRTNYPQEYQEVWEKYGRRGDKKEGYEVWKKLNLTEIEIAMLHRSIDRYAKNNEWQFRKHICRYLKTDWREVEPVLDTADGKQKPKWLQRVGNSSDAESNSGNEGEAAHG